MISTGDDAAAESDEQWNDQWQVHQCRTENGFRVGIAVDFGNLRKAHRNHGGDADDGSGRQVDTAGYDDLRNTDRNDADDGHLQDDDLQPLLVEDTVEAI